MPRGENILDRIVQKFKNFYYFFEDKWYNMLDKIEPKIPVYKIIDPIDNVIPSFVLFLLVLFFIIILLGYFIQFTSPFELTFTVYDSTDNTLLSGVAINGFVNDQEITVITANDGKAISEVQGLGKNIYALFFGMLFGRRDDFEGYINAKKTGYESEQLQLESGVLEKEIFLQPIPIDPPVVYGSVTVRLIDSSNNSLIKDNDQAYIKFSCKNSSVSKTVNDSADGARDGLVKLNETNCDFLIEEAGAAGYEKNNSSRNPSPDSTIDIILDKIPTKEGTAIIFVSEKGSNESKPISGLRVNFSGEGFNETAMTVSNGFATKTLEEGTYTITINDPENNYYPLTSDNNVKIQISVGKTTEASIELELIPEDKKRKAFIKIVDNDGPVPGATVNFYIARTDGNIFLGYESDGTPIPQIFSGTTDSNGLLEAKQFSVEHVGRVIGVIKKQGYNTKIFVPTLIDYNNSSYEIIEVRKTTETNSSKALVSVTVGENNALIPGIKTFLWQEIIEREFTFVGLVDTKDTNSAGMSFYNALTPGKFFARANYRTTIADSNKQIVSEGETGFFNIHINTNVAKIEIVLKNFNNKQIIPSQSQAIVKLYETRNNILIFKENMIFSQDSFSSNYVGLEESFFITVSLNGFREDFLEINNGALVKGTNKFYVYLIRGLDRTPCLSCDYNNGYECLVNENEEFVCVKPFDNGREICNDDTNCEDERNPICPDGKFVWNQDQNGLECAVECNGSWAKYDNIFVCYQKNFPHSPDGRA
ncbi:MAG: hypothetical protein PHP82_01670, partial [Candidatus ainarchaeum sp.]|nr:hypothetical protein [Candidatus ainarchaeum sp.]